MKRIVISVGEPAGIGPDIVLQLLQQEHACQLVLVANESMLLERAKKLGLSVVFHSFDEDVRQTLPKGECFILDMPLAEPVTPGQLAPENAAYVLACIQKAAQLCLDKKADALVTGPVHKGVICDAGIAFDGHTDFLRRQAGVDHVVMMLANAHLKVALVTTHVPLIQVPGMLTQERISQTVLIVDAALKQKGISNPQIALTGLNPHAGEGGHMGREEIDIIEPAIVKLKEQGLSVFGPLPGDTAFVPHIAKPYDVIVAMYHDQGLGPIKTIGFDESVNITLGLPFVRASVDHGTALDLAGTGKASAASLNAALRWCLG